MPTYQDLTGEWKNSADDGTYYFRQITSGDSSPFAWYGEGSSASDPVDFSNVALGTREDDELTVRWCDVPKGPPENPGDMTTPIKLSISQSPLQVKVVKPSGTGNFKYGTFTPA